MTRRVKITKLPQAGYGRPISEGWSTKNKNGYTASLLSDKTSSPVRKTLTSVPREEANVEAEGGETVVGDFQKDGLDEFYNIQGPRHADGPGVPLNLPESFIFSDTKKMRINNPDLLKIFGKSKGSYTPAALSKRYQLNDYNAKLLDKDTDTLEKETAELMINNNRDKLSKLAIIQEVYLKGGNVPKFAFPYLEKKGINTSQLATDQDDINEEQYRYGGYLPKAQVGQQKKEDKKVEYDYLDKSVSEGAGKSDYEYKLNPWQTQGTGTIGSQTQTTNFKKDPRTGVFVDESGKPLVDENFFGNHPLTKGEYDETTGTYGKGLYDNYPGGFDAWFKDIKGTGEAEKRAGMAWVDAANRYSQKYSGADVIDKSKPDYWKPGRDFVSVGTFERKTPPASEPLEKMVPRSVTIPPPSVERTGPPAFNTPAQKKEGEEEKQTYDYSQYPSQPFFKSDVVDLYGSAFSLFDNTDVGPTYQRVAGPRTINPVLEDPTRAIANRQEGAARATDAIKAFGRNPSSAASYMQGLAAGDTADIISGVNQRNIGTLNQTQGFNAQMLGNYDRMRQMADRQYDVDLATYLQQKANTRAQKRNVFTNKLSQAYTNQGNVNLLNAQDPSFVFSTRANNIRFTGQPGNEEASTETGFTRKNTANMSPDELERYEKELSIRDIESRIASRNQLGYVPRRGGAGWRQQAGLPGSRQ